MRSVVFKKNCYAEYHSGEFRYAECHYAECRYAECHYGEFRYAQCHYAESRNIVVNVVMLIVFVPQYNDTLQNNKKYDNQQSNNQHYANSHL